MSIKIIVVGNSGTGKTSLVRRFTDDFFSQHPATIGIDFLPRLVNIDGRKVMTHIYDTAGQERFGSLSKVYYRNIHAVVLVYDITNEKSFVDIPLWIKMIKDNCGTLPPCFLVANKMDLREKRVVSSEEGMHLAEMFGISHFESSALSSQGVNILFETLCRRVLASGVKLTRVSTFEVEEEKKESSCCNL